MCRVSPIPSPPTQGTWSPVNVHHLPASHVESSTRDFPPPCTAKRPPFIWSTTQCEPQERDAPSFPWTRRGRWECRSDCSTRGTTVEKTSSPRMDSAPSPHSPMMSRWVRSAGLFHLHFPEWLWPASSSFENFPPLMGPRTDPLSLRMLKHVCI